MTHEVVFCLLFPFYRCLSGRGRAVVAGAVLILGWFTGSMLVQAQLFFLIGMLFYDLFTSGYRLPVRLPKWGYYVAFTGLYLATYAAGKLGSQWVACLPMVILAFLLFDFVLTQAIRVPQLCVAISKASYAIYLNHIWALLLYYAIISRLTGELVFYSRWPYYSGVIVAILCSMPTYWLVDKRIGAYLSRLKQAATSATGAVPYLEEELETETRKPAFVGTGHALAA